MIYPFTLNIGDCYTAFSARHRHTFAMCLITIWDDQAHEFLCIDYYKEDRDVREFFNVGFKAIHADYYRANILRADKIGVIYDMQCRGNLKHVPRCNGTNFQDYPQFEGLDEDIPGWYSIEDLIRLQVYQEVVVRL